MGPQLRTPQGDSSVPLNPRHLGLDSPNCILSGRSSWYHVREFAGTMSIKAVLSGDALWTTAEGRHRVDPNGYLLLAHGQSYSLTIEARHRVETLVLFLRRGLVAEAAAALSRRPEALLDDHGQDQPDPQVPERVRRHDAIVTPALREVRHVLLGDAPYQGYLEERFLALAERLAFSQREVRRQVARLSGTRLSTRQELWRRVSRARDFAEDNLDRPVSLEALARIACLAPHHFHRQFALAFGAPPHRWLSGRRLDEARRLLEETGDSVTSICMEVGFASPGSFSAAFRRRFGLPPSAVRRRRARD